MSKQTGIVVALVAVVAIVAGVITYVVMTSDKTESSETNNSTRQEANDLPAQENATQQDDEAPAGATTEVVFTDSGFDKDVYAVKAGEALLIKNNSSDTLQFSSDDHPTHTLNGELNAPPISPGETTELTPNTPGTYGIHDHIRSQFTTMVEVRE